MNCIVDAWAEHEAELRGYLTRQLADAAQAEDILQETFLRAVSQGKRFCDVENPRAWLFRVARNLIIDAARRGNRQSAISEPAQEIPQHIEKIPVVQTLDVCLPSALSHLDEDDREVIQRCDLDGERHADYARDKGITLAAAKSRVQRARKRLKSQLVSLCQVNFDEQGNVCCYQSDNNNAC